MSEETVVTIPGFSICRDIVIIKLTLLLFSLMLLCWNSCLLDLYVQSFCYHFIFFKNIRITKASKYLTNFSFWLQWRWAFVVFKWTAGRIIWHEKIKMKLAKNIQERIFKRKMFLYKVVFYQILMLYKFLIISYILLQKLTSILFFFKVTDAYTELCQISMMDCFPS